MEYSRMIGHISHINVPKHKKKAAILMTQNQFNLWEMKKNLIHLVK